MTSPSTICINNNFSTCKSWISSGSSNNESTRWIYIENCFFINVFFGNNLSYNQFFDLLINLFISNIFCMLNTNQYGMNSNRSNVSSFFFIFNSNLSFMIRLNPVDNFFFITFSKSFAEIMSIKMSQWHSFFSLIGGISNHKTLVSGS